MRLFDLHCDTIYRCIYENQGLYKNDFAVSISKAQNYYPWIQCFAIWIPDDVREVKAFDLFNKAHEKLLEEININQKYIKLCKEKSDFEDLEVSKKNGAIFTVEGSAALGSKLENIYALAKAGVKIITLTWNSSCEAGDGAMVENPKGITPFGKELVKKMNELNIIVDISHASDKLFYDVLSINKKPLIATHSNSRSVCDHKRNLTDEQFAYIKSTGGIVGINLCKHFLNSTKEPDFSDIEKHIYHFLSLGGEKSVAFGADLDGADLPKDFNGISSMENVYDYLLSKNYKEQLLDDIFFNNAYNFFKHTF